MQLSLVVALDSTDMWLYAQYVTESSQNLALKNRPERSLNYMKLVFEAFVAKKLFEILK